MNKILIVEDESLLTYAYTKVLQDLAQEESLEPLQIISCNSFNATIHTLNQSIKNNIHFDLCLIDYRLGSKNSEDKNGLTIGCKIREIYPSCKIVLITSISDNYIFNTIIENLNPSGFLIKTDADYDSLKRKLLLIMRGSKVYSKQVNDFLKKRNNSSIHKIDNRDLNIIKLMNEGLSLPEIGKKIGLSLRGVENRKRIIAKKIGAPSPSKKDLLHFVKKEMRLI